MNWFKKAAQQLDLFDKAPERQEERVPQEEQVPEQEAPEEDNGIEYFGTIRIAGAYLVKFKVRDTFYAFKMGGQKECDIVQKMSIRSHGKAFVWAKKNASECLEVRRDYPAYGSIIRECD